MPVSYNEIAALDDPLPNNRHMLRFPTIPGILDGNGLTMRHTTVALPPLNVGQIIVPQLGWNLAFAGLRMQENQFTAEFIEGSKGPVIKNLARWQDTCAGMKSHLSKMKADYAIGCECTAYDTAGTSALKVKLYNVWPMNIVYGQFDEESGAAHVQVTFSVDCIDIADIVSTDIDFERSIPTSKPQPELWYDSRTNANFNSGSASNFNVYNSVLKQMNGIGDITNLLGRYF